MSTHASSARHIHLKQTLLAELLLVTEIQLIILLARWVAGNADAVFLLSGAFLFLGIFATAFFLVRRAGMVFILCGAVPIVAGLVQLLLSFGVEWALLASFTVLLLADMVANLILLAISFWQSSHGGRRTP